jgi:hypothetical protein
MPDGATDIGKNGAMPEPRSLSVGGIRYGLSLMTLATFISVLAVLLHSLAGSSEKRYLSMERGACLGKRLAIVGGATTKHFYFVGRVGLL